MNNSVFICYRRNISGYIARAVFQDLRANGIDAFVDAESIDAEEFETIILNQIAARPYFLLILTPGTLERCVEPGDWLLCEINRAIKLKRVIVPLVGPNFDFGDAKRFLPEPLATELPRFNAVSVPHDYFEAAMERLRTRFLRPIDLPVTPTPKADRAAVRRKVEQAAAEALVTEKQLSAQNYFERAWKRSESDLDGKIADYSEAIRLNPRHAEAYNNRGVARSAKGDLEGALADYSEAIRLNPRGAGAYGNRGIARRDKGDLDGAIADTSEAIRLRPQNAEVYNNRGIARRRKGDLDGALADYNEAIRLKPHYAEVYNNRGSACYIKGDLEGALADYNEAIRLNPQIAIAYSNRGEVYFAQGRWQAALADFKRAIQLKPDLKPAIAGLAVTLHALGQRHEAKRVWQWLLARDARYRDADRVSKELNWAQPLIDEARSLIGEL